MSDRRSEPGPMEALHQKLDRVLVILEGRHDEDGDHHPGLSHRVKQLEDFAASVRRWAAVLTTAVIAALATAWSLFGAGPRTPHP